MWLDAYLQNVLIRSQIAEAQRDAALRRLVEQAKSSTDSGRRRSPLREHIVRASSRLWPKRRIERTVLP
jgi:hypothetical protein